MQIIDHTILNTNLRCLICTDFGATLDLSAAEKEKRSVDNHAFVCVFFVTQNLTRVNYKRAVKVEEFLGDETIINDCEKWIFFGDTMLKGKRITMFSIIYGKLT